MILAPGIRRAGPATPDRRPLLRRLFNQTLSTSLLGVDAGTWRRLLRDNSFSIDPEYWPRALLITVASFYNSRVLIREDRLWGHAIAATQIPPPLFVLGHWRSGTTILQRLLALNEHFGYLNFYQASFPNTFLSTEASHARLLGPLLPKTRPGDAVRVSYAMPVEEERALAILTGYSFRLGAAFPRNAERYERYITFRDAPAFELAYWKAAFERLLKKLTWKAERPLVLKSPANTARLKILLDMFPHASFVHIHRNPNDVFQSACNQMGIARQFDRLQRDSRDDLTDIVLQRYETLYAAYFGERGLIPDGRLCEVSFEELERDPVGEVQGIHQALGLPLSGETKRRLEAYATSLTSYQKNVYSPLSSTIRHKIKDRWRRCFDEWGYPG